MALKVSENEISNKLLSNPFELINKHELDRDYVLALKQLPFSHGRADVVIYGLYKGLYVIPFGVEVKREVKSVTDLSNHITQIRESYDHAFPYIYLAVASIDSKIETVVKNYLSEMGYGLIKINDDNIDVIIKASPKKSYKSPQDYNMIASIGTLYMTSKYEFLNEGFNINDINISPGWIGLTTKINFFASVFPNYAIFGVYAIGFNRVKKLLGFLNERKEFIQSLRNEDYRIYLDSMKVNRGIKGWMRLIDEQVSINTIKVINSLVSQGIKPMPVPRWGTGFGIYKRLWNVENVPIYNTALAKIKEALNQLKVFREEGIIS